MLNAAKLEHPLALNESTPTPELHICELLLIHLYTDDTSHFPICAQSGNKYIVVAYHHTANPIMMQPFAPILDCHRIAAMDTIIL